MSDTPETDARTYVPSLGASTVPADFARRLERERDEARDAIRVLAKHGESEIQKITKERDEWSAMCGRYKQERDEVKEKYRFAVIHWQIGSAKMERERDEARDILRKLLEIIPEPECHDFGHTKEERHTFFEKCPVMERYDALIAQAKDVAK